MQNVPQRIASRKTGVQQSAADIRSKCISYKSIFFLCYLLFCFFIYNFVFFCFRFEFNYQKVEGDAQIVTDDTGQRIHRRYSQPGEVISAETLF